VNNSTHIRTGEVDKVQVLTIVNAINANNVVRTFASFIVKGQKIGKCELHPMPGNCGMLVSTQLSMATNFQRKGFTSVFREHMYDIAKKDLGYSYIIATTIMTNKAELGSSKKAGWETLGEGFINTRTKNEIVILGKKL